MSNKYNCNNTVEFAHVVRRMCDTFHYCNGCPCDDIPCETRDISLEFVRRVQEWSDAHPEISLTAEQREVLKAMLLLGFKYIAKDANGKTYIYTSRPIKGNVGWSYTGAEFISVTQLSGQAITAISPLVEWEDKEPLNIKEALKNGDNI